MTEDQVIPAAIVAVVLILVVAGAVRVATRRRGANEEAFGAGGITKVPIGTTGSAQTDLAPSGVVYLLGEQWSARSRTGESIASDSTVVVVGRDALTLIVDPQPSGQPTAD